MPLFLNLLFFRHTGDILAIFINYHLHWEEVQFRHGLGSVEGPPLECRAKNRTRVCLQCKKVYKISRPQPGCHLPNSPWPGIIYIVPVPGRFGKKNLGISWILFTVYHNRWLFYSSLYIRVWFCFHLGVRFPRCLRILIRYLVGDSVWLSFSGSVCNNQPEAR